MKQFIFISIGFIVISCMQPLEKSSTKQNYVVKGMINGDVDNVIKVVYGHQIDTIQVENNTFVFQGEVSSPTAFKFELDSLTMSNRFYLESDTLTFDIIIDDIVSENRTFKDFTVKQLSGGTSNELINYSKSLVKSTPKSKANRTLLVSKIDSLIKAYPNHDYFGKLLSELSMNHNLSYNDVRSLLSKLDQDELNSTDMEILEKFQQKRRNFQIGSEIPNYELLTTTESTVPLNSTYAKYNLIQFWNSWCKACLEQHSLLKEVYETYHEKGFEIIGITLDANHEDWSKAVAIEKLPWTNLRIDAGFTGEMATDMGVMDLPEYYLVDEKGRILEINLSFEELQRILDALLK